jgi:hypothetical protein
VVIEHLGNRALGGVADDLFLDDTVLEKQQGGIPLMLYFPDVNVFSSTFSFTIFARPS